MRVTVETRLIAAVIFKRGELAVGGGVDQITRSFSQNLVFAARKRCLISLSFFLFPVIKGGNRTASAFVCSAE